MINLYFHILKGISFIMNKVHYKYHLTFHLLIPTSCDTLGCH